MLLPSNKSYLFPTTNKLLRLSNTDTKGIISCFNFENEDTLDKSYNNTIVLAVCIKDIKLLLLKSILEQSFNSILLL